MSGGTTTAATATADEVEVVASGDPGADTTVVLKFMGISSSSDASQEAIMAGPVKAFNHTQGASAAVVGPARSRIRQIVIFADAAGAFTIKNGSASGEVLITQTFPTGLHHLNIPDDGIIATDGAFVAAFTGSNNQLTIFLS